MTNEDIINIIDRRIEEHKAEIVVCNAESDKLKEQRKTDKPNLELLQKLAVLKDRSLFNRASLLVLNDLKKEINEIK